MTESLLTELELRRLLAASGRGERGWVRALPEEDSVGEACFGLALPTVAEESQGGRDGFLQGAWVSTRVHAHWQFKKSHSEPEERNFLWDADALEEGRARPLHRVPSSVWVPGRALHQHIRQMFPASAQALLLLAPCHLHRQPSFPSLCQQSWARVAMELEHWTPPPRIPPF